MSVNPIPSSTPLLLPGHPGAAASPSPGHRAGSHSSRLPQRDTGAGHRGGLTAPGAGSPALSTCQATGLLEFVQNAQEQGLPDGRAWDCPGTGEGVTTWSLFTYKMGTYVVGSRGLRRGKDMWHLTSSAPAPVWTQVFVDLPRETWPLWPPSQRRALPRHLPQIPFPPVAIPGVGQVRRAGTPWPGLIPSGILSPLPASSGRPPGAGRSGFGREGVHPT